MSQRTGNTLSNKNGGACGSSVSILKLKDRLDFAAAQFPDDQAAEARHEQEIAEEPDVLHRRGDPANEQQLYEEQRGAGQEKTHLPGCDATAERGRRRHHRSRQ